jgi:hypothetical protein
MFFNVNSGRKHAIVRRHPRTLSMYADVGVPLKNQLSQQHTDRPHEDIPSWGVVAVPVKMEVHKGHNVTVTRLNAWNSPPLADG